MKSKRLDNGIDNDQFYTKEDVAKHLSEHIKRSTWFKDVTRIIEPAAGYGSFSNQFPECIAIDIDPKDQSIIKEDFLSLSFENNCCTLVVGNPPFGRQCSLALKFLNKSCEFAKYIAFILPKSFKKISVQNKVSNSHSILEEIDIPDDSFYNVNGDCKVPSVFQIWVDKPKTKVTLKTNSSLFRWVPTPQEANYAIRRVGFYAGRIEPNPLETNKETHYYIQCENSNVINCLKTIDWTKYSTLTSGPRSLSKSEIILALESQYEPTF